LPGLSGALALVVFAPLFLATFVALLVALGLSSSDRQFLASFWDAVRRNMRRGTPPGGDPPGASRDL
jgi:hypothetical protein